MVPAIIVELIEIIIFGIFRRGSLGNYFMELFLFIFDQVIDIKSRVQSIGIYIWRKRKLNEEIFFHVRINVHFIFELKFTTLNKNNFYTIWNREREKFFPISQITNNILFRIRIQHRNTFSIFIYTIKIHHPEWKYDFHDIYGRRKLDEEIPYSYKRALPFSFAHNSKFARISTCVSSFLPDLGQSLITSRTLLHK